MRIFFPLEQIKDMYKRELEDRPNLGYIKYCRQWVREMKEEGYDLKIEGFNVDTLVEYTNNYFISE